MSGVRGLVRLMRMTRLRIVPRLAAAIGLCLVAAGPARAEVVKFVVNQTSPVAGGVSFGDVGPYERLDGVAHFEVDPGDALNKVIVNIDKAPRNGRGRVEFSAPFVILKPVDVARGNRKILYGINNRGNLLELPWLTFPSAGMNAALDAHDGLLFRLGYTFVDAGWAGDITTTANPTRLGATLPVAERSGGRPIAAPIRIEYNTASGYTLPLKGNTQFRTYETADPKASHATLTVRDGMRGAKVRVPADQWAFGRCPTGRDSLTATRSDICLFDGFKADKVYELVYQAEKPWVMGLAYAVTRDFASFLRTRAADRDGQANPLAPGGAPGVRRVYGLGISSTGMYMREFLYLGFNEDEAHRQVFEAVRIMIPGTHRLFANVEFADPNVYSRQDQHADFLSSSVAPLTYAITTDPISGVRDGILKRPATDPLVFHVDSANEFWQMKASLNAHDGKRQPVPTPDRVRFYFAASHSHIGASGVGATPTAAGTCAFPMNGALSFNTLLRALVVAMDEWADKGIAPPASRYPRLEDGTLITREDAAKSFPRIPGASFPTTLNELSLLDYGKDFKGTGGRLTRVPPRTRAVYPTLVPSVDADGLDMGGIRTVDIAVPVGTNTGWNLRAPGPRGANLCGLNGSFFPFARTKAERAKGTDPRPSLEERYGDHAGFVRAVEDAARTLVDQRFLLKDDVKGLVAAAESSAILK